MAVRTLRLQMKKGLAIMKECTEIPIKENCLLHVNEFTFYCNPTTFDKLVRIEAQEDMQKADKELTEFFLKTANAANIQGMCYNFDAAVAELKTDLVLGKENVGKMRYNDHWEPERDENVLKALNQKNLERLASGQEKPQIYTSPNNNYKAMVDIKNESIEFIQFEEVFSALKGKNVIAEHVNINRRPMYVIDKLLALVLYIRDKTENRKWGE